MPTHLSPADWEDRLTAHYLRSDGPLGSSPLLFVDATPLEIGSAAGLGGTDTEVQKTFLAQFNAASVAAWLGGGNTPWVPSGGSTPGFFRFLVLTCFITAAEQGAGTSRNFRIRLGELLGLEGPVNSVLGVNELWVRLARWSTAQRRVGHPIRKIVLPHDGGASRIGIATHIVFPSWEDRRTLARLFVELAPDARRSPRILVDELSRPFRHRKLPARVRVAFDEFADAVREGQRLLAGHRFWRLSQSVANGLEQRMAKREQLWRLIGRFSGFDEETFTLELYRSSSDWELSDPEWHGSFAELIARDPMTLPAGLGKTIGAGLALLHEMPGACWGVGESDAGVDGNDVVILAREPLPQFLSQLRTKWQPIAKQWRVSERVAASAIPPELKSRRIDSARGALADLSVVGGVRLNRQSWLGRPGFLPAAEATPLSTLESERLDEAHGEIRVTGKAPRWPLHCLEPVQGLWRLRAREPLGEAEQTVCFEASRVEKREFPAPGPELDEDVELQASMPSGAPPMVRPLPSIIGEVAAIVEHCLEAIYSTPRRCWSEGELIPLLKDALPPRSQVWDFLRSAAEAGFVEARLSPRWKARTWYLMPPRIVAMGATLAVVEGALGAAARMRLIEVAGKLGGVVTIVPGPGGSSMVPVMVTTGVVPHSLAEVMGWSVEPATWPRHANAPACWPRELRSKAGRIVDAIWDFEGGFFHDRSPDGSAGTLLQRLAREQRDDRDVYLLCGGGEDIVLGSRTAAILEACRRNSTELFMVRDRWLERRGKTGHLPLPIARALRRCFLCPSGPFGEGGYAYPVDREAAAQLRASFGAAIGTGAPGTPAEPTIAEIALSRRRGIRPIWYRPNVGERG